ncbi:hypothetical protein HDU91_002019, partial [Kappamyces sp. JEL0680]
MDQDDPSNEPQKETLAQTITNIFGDSDSDDDDLGQVQDVTFDSDDELELPSFKKRDTDDDNYTQLGPARK